MLWHINLKFCIWPCFTVLQIKFQCCQFPSIFVGVMPLLELRILKMHSFSALFSDTLWHMELKCIWLCFTVLQIKSECPKFALIIVLDMPLLELRILEVHSFLHFLLRALTYWAEILHMTLFNILKIKFECHNSVSVWLSIRPSIFCTFLLHASTYLAEN